MANSSSPGTATPGEKDVRLVREFLRGDEAAKESLLERMRCVPRFLARRNERWGRPFESNELDDLSQNVMISAWRKLNTFEGRGTLEAWLNRFVQLEMSYRMRTRHRRPVSESELLGDLQEESADGDAERLGERELLTLALSRIDPSQAEVVRARCVLDMTFAEIGEVLGCPENTVKTRYYRGLRELRRILNPAEAQESP